MYLRIWGSFKSAKKLGLQIANPQIAKIYGPQITNPQIATFAEGPRIFKKIQVRKFADLRFANIFADLPPLEIPHHFPRHHILLI
jgi:hypothetical protein